MMTIIAIGSTDANCVATALRELAGCVQAFGSIKNGISGTIGSSVQFEIECFDQPWARMAHWLPIDSSGNKVAVHSHFIDNAGKCQKCE